MSNNSASARFLKKIDLFGEEATLSINGDDSYSTSTGGVFSFLIGLLIMAYAYFSFAPVFSSNNNTFTYQSTFIEKPGNLNLTQPDFAFVITVSLNG